MRQLAGFLIFAVGVALGLAWTQPSEAPARAIPLGPTAEIEVLVAPSSARRLRVALTLTARPEELAELIGADLARGNPTVVRALVDALAEMPLENSAGVFRAVVLDPLLHPSLRVYGVEELGRAGAAATPLLRELLALERDQNLRVVIERSLETAKGVGGTGVY